MNKVYQISLNYLAVLMLVIANLLPVASVFAEGLTKPEENIFDSESFYIKADTKKNETNNKLVDVNYEVTNKSDQPIEQVVLKQKNPKDSPVKFDAATLKSEDQLVAPNDQTIQFDQKENQDEGTELIITTIQPQTTKHLTISAEQTDESIHEFAVEINQADEKVGDITLTLPKIEQEASSTSLQEKEAETEIAESQSEESTTATPKEETITTSEDTNQETPTVQAIGPRIAPTPGRGFDQPIYKSIHKGELFQQEIPI